MVGLKIVLIFPLAIFELRMHLLKKPALLAVASFIENRYLFGDLERLTMIAST